MQFAPRPRGKALEEESCNVRVCVRCRPTSDLEKSDRASFQILECRPEQKEVVVTQTIPGRKLAAAQEKTYTFDHVFDCATQQDTVFDRVCRPVVDEVVQGFNCTLFAYGQTGTGKTYTIEGALPSGDGPMPTGAGVIPRSVRAIFEHLSKEASSEYSVRVSYLEIYNEELIDLLTDEKQQLRIYEDAKTGTSVERLCEIPVRDPGSALSVLEKASRKKQVAETLMNRNSSRSHSIFTISIHREVAAECSEEDVIKTGKLHLVDLAGSECIGRSGSVLKQAKEAGMINQSLLTLGRVITALVDHTGHIPYRDSKLTRLLQDSLGGHTKTCIVATVSPSSANLEETMSTLDYAHRAKSIRNRPQVNQKVSPKLMLKELSSEIGRLEDQLRALWEKDAVYLPPHQHVELVTTIERTELDRSQREEELRVLSTEVKEVEENCAQTQARLDVERKGHAAAAAQLRDDTMAREQCEWHTASLLQKCRELRYIWNVVRESELSLAGEATGRDSQLQEIVVALNALFAKVEAFRAANVQNTVAVQRLMRSEWATATANAYGWLRTADAAQQEHAQRVQDLRASASDQVEKDGGLLDGPAEGLCECTWERDDALGAVARTADALDKTGRRVSEKVLVEAREVHLAQLAEQQRLRARARQQLSARLAGRSEQAAQDRAARSAALQKAAGPEATLRAHTESVVAVGHQVYDEEQALESASSAERSAWAARRAEALAEHEEACTACQAAVESTLAAALQDFSSPEPTFDRLALAAEKVTTVLTEAAQREAVALENVSSLFAELLVELEAGRRGEDKAGEDLAAADTTFGAETQKCVGALAAMEAADREVLEATWDEVATELQAAEAAVRADASAATKALVQGAAQAGEVVVREVRAMDARLEEQHRCSFRLVDEMGSAVETAVLQSWSDLTPLGRHVLDGAEAAHRNFVTQVRAVERDGLTPVRRPPHRAEPIRTVAPRNLTAALEDVAQEEAENAEPNVKVWGKRALSSPFDGAKARRTPPQRGTPTHFRPAD